MTSRMFHKASFGNSGNPYNMFFASLLLHLIVIAAVLMTVPERQCRSPLEAHFATDARLCDQA